MGSSGTEAGAGQPGVLLAPLTHLPFAPEDLRAPLVRSFGRPAEVGTVIVDLEAAYDAHRNQYHSTKLLRQLLDELPPGNTRLVGLVDVDLFVPVLTYVFGEAQLGGRVAIVSGFRLREPWLAGGAPATVFHRRLVKTVLHELGHTAGLRHCPDPRCIMTAASSLEMLDEKGDEYCLECKALLREAGIRVVR